MDKDKKYLRQALFQAEKSYKMGGFPAGAVLVKNNKIISKGLSLGFKNNDPTGHAESDAIRMACKKLKTTNLAGATLYSSLEPCLMCFSAANWAQISQIVYGCKKNATLIKNGCYEGKISLSTINKDNNLRIKLKYKPYFKNNSLELFNSWLKSL